jgi:hypothetical protein
MRDKPPDQSWTHCGTTNARQRIRVHSWNHIGPTRLPDASVIRRKPLSRLVNALGLEPRTYGLKVRCSTD